MKNRRKLLGLTLLIAIAIGTTAAWINLTSQAEDVTVIEGNLGKYELITRKQALGKPKIDFKLPGGSRFTWPKPNERAREFAQHFKEGISAIVTPRPEHERYMSGFSDGEFEVDGIPIRMSPWGSNIPYVYGDRSVTIRYRADNDVPWVSLNVLPNNKPIPSSAPAEIKLDRYTVRVQALGPFFTLLPTRIQIEVLGGDPSQEFGVYMGYSMVGGLVRCGPKPGILMVESAEPEVELNLMTLKRESVKVNVTVKTVGTKRIVTVHDHHGHELCRAEEDRSSISIRGGWSCWEDGTSGYFQIEGDQLDSLPRIRQAEMTDDYEVIRNLKAGPMDVTFYSIVKQYSGKIKLDFPTP